MGCGVAALSAIAFVCSYNEADMISWTVCHLRRQGCDVHLIDCRSTDDTARLAAACGATVEDDVLAPLSRSLGTMVRWYNFL